GPPDRTSVLPPTAAPTSGPGTGNYRRGAAAVPIPSGPPYGHVPTEGYTTQRPPQRKGNGLMVAGVVLAVVVVLAGLGGIGYALFGGKGDGDGGGGRADNTPTVSATHDRGGNKDGVITLPNNGEDYLHLRYADAAQQIRDLNLRPVRKNGEQSHNYEPGEVNQVYADKPLHRGDPVYLYVEPNHGNGNGNMQTLPGSGDGNNGGGNDHSNSPSPTPWSPSPQSPSAGASASADAQDSAFHGGTAHRATATPYRTTRTVTPPSPPTAPKPPRAPIGESL
ncbi:MAG: hypothetical protein WCA46_14635, partial [Actinocatenispora sp.]